MLLALVLGGSGAASEHRCSYDADLMQCGSAPWDLAPASTTFIILNRCRWKVKRLLAKWSG